MSLRLPALALALVATGCEGFGTCQEVVEDGPGLTGTLAYTLGDGTRLEATLERSWVRLTGKAEITIAGDFMDAFGRDRHYTLRIGELAPGLLDVAGRGAICLVRQTGSPEVCSDLVGSIDVRQLAYECYEHESGISACAETRELALHVTSAWQGTTFALDGSELTIGSWVDTECAD
jgi:hypothetical protein